MVTRAVTIVPAFFIIYSGGPDVAAQMMEQAQVGGAWQILLDTPPNALQTLVARIKRHPMTWRAISVRP